MKILGIEQNEGSFEVEGETTKAEPCQNQEKKSEKDKPHYDEDGLGLLDFD